MTKYPLLFLLLFGSVFSDAQTEDLRRSADFFEGQIPVYQAWLKNTGFDQYLSVREIAVEKDDLSVYLEFPFEDVDSVRIAWDLLEMAQAETSSLSISQQLFYKAQILFEVAPNQIHVQLYETSDLSKASLFQRGLYYEDGRVNTEQSDPKDKKKKIVLTPAKLNISSLASSPLSKQLPASKVYECAEAFFAEKFSSLSNAPLVEYQVWENREILRVQVNGLTGEALPASKNQSEKMAFTLVYQAKQNAIHLELVIEAYHRAQNWDLPRGGYANQEVSFNQDLTVYSNKLLLELQRFILSCE